MRCTYGYDCFNCPASDCFVDYFPRKVTRESDLIDLAVLRENRKNRFRPRKKFKLFRGRPGTYYALHREERLSYQHQYYLDNRQRLHQYYLDNRQRLLAYAHLRYRLCFGLKFFENYSKV